MYSRVKKGIAKNAMSFLHAQILSITNIDCTSFEKAPQPIPISFDPSIEKDDDF